MKIHSLAAVAVVLASTLALGVPLVVEEEPPHASPAPLVDETPTFTAQRILDRERAGGEPVIAILPSGTILVAAHPGWTHANRADPNLVTGANGQSYVWRSADGGETFARVARVGGTGDVPGLANVPFSDCVPGLSDPDFAVTAEGVAYFTDFYKTGASVLRSLDDGQTWECRNLEDGPTRKDQDRPWLAARGDEVFFVSNFGGGHKVLRSVDGGATFVHVGTARCGGDLSIGADGLLFVGCSGGGLERSRDGGATWTRISPRGPQLVGAAALPEPAIDAAGNVYVAAVGFADRKVYLSVLPRDADAFLPPYTVSDAPVVPSGEKMWPWVTAGSEGRVAVTWYGTEGPMTLESEWRVFVSFVTEAASDSPTVTTVVATPQIVHRGRIQPGLALGLACDFTLDCVRNPRDRRMGDFFETAVDPQGFLHVVYSDTQAVGAGGLEGVPAGISHVGYVRQTGGVRLYASPADVHWYS
ncbi:MAG TPA: sialidase family protein [Candidatus Thermoplasmatota archaeon]|nr:sialidase family protein [Candidatus Thermoplasmatota archaeon]